MDGSLVFNFNNYNDSIAKGLKYVGNNLYLDIIIDDKLFSRIGSSKTFYNIPPGKHWISCILYYESNGDIQKYYTKEYMFDTNDTAVFTLNLYFVTYERGNHGFDFGPGIIPIRDKKDRTQGGCYIATCVYGSYDCPQVWTLRRYRDDRLAQTWYGRMFIRTYYAISPTLVKKFGTKKWFKNIFAPKLNRLVARLNKEGVLNTPYNDNCDNKN